MIVPSLGRGESFAARISDAFLTVRGHGDLPPAFHLVFRSDARALLSSVRAPTLVVHRRDDAWFTSDHGRLIARAIPGARYLELAGADHAPYIGNTAEIIDPITWFAQTIPPVEPEDADERQPGLTRAPPPPAPSHTAGAKPARQHHRDEGMSTISYQRGGAAERGSHRAEITA